MTTNPPIIPRATFQVDHLKVEVHQDRAAMGLAAAREVAYHLRTVLNAQKTASVVFAAAPSQNEFLAALAEQPDIEWPRVVALHMDEYVGLSFEAPQSFGHFLRDRLFAKVPLAAVHYMDGMASEPKREIARYAALLAEYPPDIVCAGIGENGHLAFNDPPIADPHDPDRVKTVALTLCSREQQVHDGCFGCLEEVPEQAITMTIPALFSAAHIACVVPGGTKAQAVRRMLSGDVSMECPASILRQHSQATLYLEPASAALWLGSDSETRG